MAYVTLDEKFKRGYFIKHNQVIHQIALNTKRFLKLTDAVDIELLITCLGKGDA